MGFVADLNSYVWSCEIINTAVCAWGLGVNLWVVATFNHVGGYFNIFMCNHQGCLNNPILFNWGLCAACWVHFIYHRELWPTSVGIPSHFSIILQVLLEKRLPENIPPLSLEFASKILLFWFVSLYQCAFLIEDFFLDLKFHWSLFLRFQFTIIQDWVRNGVQDCSNSIANALELVESCAKPSMHALLDVMWVKHLSAGSSLR